MDIVDDVTFAQDRELITDESREWWIAVKKKDPLRGPKLRSLAGVFRLRRLMRAHSRSHVTRSDIARGPPRAQTSPAGASAASIEQRSRQGDPRLQGYQGSGQKMSTMGRRRKAVTVTLRVTAPKGKRAQRLKAA
jgi:hypothetical protein